MLEWINKHRATLAGLFLIAAVAVVYGPACQYGFTLFDDESYILNNPAVRDGLSWQGLVWAFSGAHLGNWHPLTWIAHMLDCTLFGLDAGAHRLINFTLHAASAVVLFMLLQRLTGAFWRSAFVAALFALHPLRVESVVWIAERKDVLSVFFGLLALVAYSRFTFCQAQARVNRGLTSDFALLTTRSFYLLSLSFYFLSLLSKPMLVTLPFLLLLLDWWPLKRWPIHSALPTDSLGASSGLERRQLIKEKIPFFSLSLVMSVVAVVAQKQADAVSSFAELPLGERLANAALSYVRYMGKMIYPEGLSVFYVDTEWSGVELALSVLLLGLISFLALRWRKQRPWFFAGWFWYLGALVPVIGLIQVGAQTMADRYTYLPSIGFFILVIWSLAEGTANLATMKRRLLLGMLGGGALLACMIVSAGQRANWRSTELLFAQALEVCPKSKDVRHNYATALHKTGIQLMKEDAIAAAIDRFRKALEIDPTYVNAWNTLGICYSKQQLYATGEQCFRRAIQLAPKESDAFVNLAGLYQSQGKLEDAVASYQKVLEIDPNDAPVRSRLVRALSTLGRGAEAEILLQKALQGDPANNKLRFNFASLLAMNNKVGRAVSELRQILQSDPEMVPALQRLSWLLATTTQEDVRNGQEAIRLAQRACELTHNEDSLCLSALAAACAELGRFEEAISWEQKAKALAKTTAQDQLLDAFEAHLQCYRAHRPYRTTLVIGQPESVFY